MCSVLESVNHAMTPAEAIDTMIRSITIELTLDEFSCVEIVAAAARDYQ